MVDSLLSSPLSASRNESVLIVDDEISIGSSLQKVMEQFGYKARACSNAAEGLSLLTKDSFDVVLVDLMMPEIDGLAFIAKAKELSYKGIIILMSAYGNSENALQAIQFGASDFIPKPFTPEEVLFVVKKATERARLENENEILKEQISKRYSFSNIIAKCPKMIEIFDTIKKISDYSTTVLIQGESGTGKELIAKAIHFNSQRKNGRFVAINCGAIPENLLESELFGHKRGAFTDATKDKKGLFEEADKGTVLLDEIGELPPHLQVKLLRVLQERIIRPVGDTRTIPVDVRVIAATLRDLESDVISGRFRDDLLYRLNVITIRIPPLRERKEDIPILVNYFIKRNQEKLGLSVQGTTPEAMEAILEYSWPGNIRELENCIERAMILTEDDKITFESLPKTLHAQVSPEKEPVLDESNLSIKEHTKNLERQLILRALEKTKNNRTHAAKLLEISHRTLLYKLKEYGLGGDSDEGEK